MKIHNRKISMNFLSYLNNLQDNLKKIFKIPINLQNQIKCGVSGKVLDHDNKLID